MAPLCSLLAGWATLVVLAACWVPAPARFTVAAGMAILAALITPPSLRSWRLTGQHRIVPTRPQANAGEKYKIIQVG